ncbi:MAG: hypothetical protein AVO35_09630 [Candidatus Aegiribacteria sp. MLS_C]|nr:MAG: hypothetical protein AVO35_09630 [Candidatus Aegiribacteria sp. MLS_C]
MSGRSLLSIIVLAAAAAALSDEVVWDYDLTSLPDGWSLDGHNSEWTFSPDGAHMQASASSPYSTAYAIIYTDAITIPAGCDSVVFHVEQDLQRYASGTGWSAALVHYRINGMIWKELYDGPYQSTNPIHCRIPVFEGNIMEVRIQGTAVAGSDIHPGSGSINWLLWDLTLTLYGDEVGLDNSTWAAIKLFQQ